MSALKLWQQILIYMTAGAAVIAVLFYINQPPRGQAIVLTPVAAQKLVIQVDGEVTQPGVYEFEHGSRVQDALSAAGGTTANAATESLNLARLLKDGEKINVPSKTQSATTNSVKSAAIQLDLNKATLSDLDGLPGIGKTRAQAILDYRTNNGSFISVEELQKVPGISPTLYESIKDLVTVP
jgi:competence protein ComEA